MLLGLDLPDFVVVFGDIRLEYKQYDDDLPGCLYCTAPMERWEGEHCPNADDYCTHPSSITLERLVPGREDGDYGEANTGYATVARSLDGVKRRTVPSTQPCSRTRWPVSITTGTKSKRRSVGWCPTRPALLLR